MTRELVPVNEPAARRHLRLGMFAMGGLLLGLGAWKIPALDLGPSGRMVGWMALAVTVTQCGVAGLLSRRDHFKKGFRINGKLISLTLKGCTFDSETSVPASVSTSSKTSIK